MTRNATSARTQLSAKGTLMADQQQPGSIKLQSRKSGPDLADSYGAGDENRTRTISLGSGAVTAASGLDLRVQVSAGGRGCPLVTLANGT
jgi:hypothetical protein